MRRVGAVGLAGLGLALLAMGAASGQGALATFPASKSPADVATWLRRATPIAPSQVVDMNAASVTAIVAAPPTQTPRGFQAEIRAEALDPDIGIREGILSWSITVDIDCDKRLVRLGEMTGFPGRDLKDSPRIVRQADAAWVSPAERAPLGSALRALCDASFQRPLAGYDTEVAQAPASVPVAATSAPPQAYRPQPAPPKPAATPRATPPRTPPPPPSNAALYAAMRKPIVQGGGAISVQVGASPSLADVKTLLTRIQRRFGAQLGGLTTGVATVVVDRKTVHRALISGLRTNADANALCQRLQAAGQACFVRR